MMWFVCWLLLGVAKAVPNTESCAFIEGAPSDIAIHYSQKSGIENGSSQCFLVLRPKEEDRPLPMIVLLHGLGDSAVGLARSPIVERLRTDMENGTFPPVYVVIPEGERGYWTNWLYAEQLNAEGDRLYEDRLLRMIQMAQTKYNVQADKVALVGISMGGFGALSIGLRHPQMFSAIVAMSPTDMEIAVRKQPDSMLYNQVYGSPISLSYVAAMNPRELILRGAGEEQLLAWVYGTAEPDKFKIGAERLKVAAEVNGLEPHIRVVPNGEHSFENTWGGETIDWWLGLLRQWYTVE